MDVVSDEHKATLRQWYEELQEKRGLQVNLRRSATLNDVCLSEGSHFLMVQTYSLWNIRGKEWRFTALTLAAVLAAQVKTIDDRQTFVVWSGQRMGNTSVMSRLGFARLPAVKALDELLRQLRHVISLLHGSVNLSSLTEDIFRWCREQDDLLNHRHRQQRPIEFTRIRWAPDCYQADDAE